MTLGLVVMIPVSPNFQGHSDGDVRNGGVSHWDHYGTFCKTLFGVRNPSRSEFGAGILHLSGFGVEASFRQCGRGSEGDIFQNRPKQSKNAQNCPIRHFWQTLRPLGFFSHSLTACRCRSVKLQPSLVSAWCDFRRLKPPFLKPPLVFP